MVKGACGLCHYYDVKEYLRCDKINFVCDWVFNFLIRLSAQCLLSLADHGPGENIYYQGGIDYVLDIIRL